jgi:hypothetical protein
MFSVLEGRSLKLKVHSAGLISRAQRTQCIVFPELDILILEILSFGKFG